MGGKHLKRLRAEKSKVQLKKKKLSKSQNVTDTAFKVKKVITVEQLKTVNENEPVSNWNIPMKDLLIRLSHYNTTSKLNSINGMRELLAKYPHVLKGPTVKPLISRLLDLLTDEEHRIRKAAVDFLSYLFTVLSRTSLIPFYEIINVYLSCAMTHRNASVQQDSLAFIDILIKYSPEILQINFKSLAQNYVRILKNYLNKPLVLTFSASSFKLELEKTKIEMLSKFYSFVISKYPNSPETNIPLCLKKTDINFSKKISLREAKKQYKEIPDLSVLFKNSENEKKTKIESISEEFQFLCSITMPLLFEIWIEFSPGKEHGGLVSGTVMSEGTGALLCIILKIFVYLYEKSLAFNDTQMKSWFVANFSPEFKKCFVSNFPYLPLVSQSKSKLHKKNEFHDGELGCNSYVTQNLIICYLSYSLRIVHENMELENKMENYITGALTVKNSAGIEVLTKILEAMVTLSGWKKSHIFFKKIITNYITSDNTELRRELSRTLLKIITNENASMWKREESIINWIKYLANHICKSQVSTETVENLLEIINSPIGDVVIKEVECRIMEIIKNLPEVKSEGNSQFEAQKMITSIICKCSKEILKEALEEILSSNFYSQDLRNYLRQIFCHRLSYN